MKQSQQKVKTEVNEPKKEPKVCREGASLHSLLQGKPGGKDAVFFQYPRYLYLYCICILPISKVLEFVLYLYSSNIQDILVVLKKID